MYTSETPLQQFLIDHMAKVAIVLTVDRAESTASQSCPGGI